MEILKKNFLIDHLEKKNSLHNKDNWIKYKELDRFYNNIQCRK